MNEPVVLSLSSFIGFANATERRRATVVRNLYQQAGADYAPERDFWKRMREAIRRDRKTTRDGSTVFETAVHATKTKQGAYTEVAHQWMQIIDRWSGATFSKPLNGVARVRNLELTIKPHFVERWSSQQSERVIPYLNMATLTPATVSDILRLGELAFGSQPTEGTALLDVRRGRVHSVQSEDVATVDARLADLADEIVDRWDRLDGS
jgi:hypothetical protein